MVTLYVNKENFVEQCIKYFTVVQYTCQGSRQRCCTKHTKQCFRNPPGTCDFIIQNIVNTEVLVSLLDSLRLHGLQSFRLLYPWDFPTRILEWIAIPFSRGSSQSKNNPGIEPRSPALQVDSLPSELNVVNPDTKTLLCSYSRHVFNTHTHTHTHTNITLLLLLSHFSRVQLCATLQAAAHQAPPSLGFSRQEHWSGLPFPSPMHESEVTQSCPTLSNPMDFSLLGSSVHGIFRQGYWSGVPLSSLNITQSNIKIKINGAAFTVFIIIEWYVIKGFFPHFLQNRVIMWHGCQNSHKRIFFNRENSPRFHFH